MLPLCAQGPSSTCAQPHTVQPVQCQCHTPQRPGRLWDLSCCNQMTTAKDATYNTLGSHPARQQGDTQQGREGPNTKAPGHRTWESTHQAATGTHTTTTTSYEAACRRTVNTTRGGLQPRFSSAAVDGQDIKMWTHTGGDWPPPRTACSTAVCMAWECQGCGGKVSSRDTLHRSQRPTRDEARARGPKWVPGGMAFKQQPHTTRSHGTLHCCCTHGHRLRPAAAPKHQTPKPPAKMQPQRLAGLPNTAQATKQPAAPQPHLLAASQAPTGGPRLSIEVRSTSRRNCNMCQAPVWH